MAVTVTALLKKVFFSLCLFSLALSIGPPSALGLRLLPNVVHPPLIYEYTNVGHHEQTPSSTSITAPSPSTSSSPAPAPAAFEFGFPNPSTYVAGLPIPLIDAFTAKLSGSNPSSGNPSVEGTAAVSSVRMAGEGAAAAATAPAPGPEGEMHI